MKRIVISIIVLFFTGCTTSPPSTTTPTPVLITSQPQPTKTIETPYSQTFLPLQGVSDRPQSDLDPAYEPLDLYGEEYVSIGPDGEIYLFDISDGKRLQITSDGLSKGEAVLSDQYIAWLGTVGETGAADLFVFNRTSGEQRKITASPTIRMQLVLDGMRLVWADKRNEENAYYADFDLYAYDLEVNIDYEIAVAPGAQYNPSISGNRLVWQDNRNSPHLNEPLAGCGNCPKNQFDIYMYDFTTGVSQPLVENEWLKSEPFIEGDQVVWAEYRSETGTEAIGGSADLFLLDLLTSQIQQVTESPESETNPTLVGPRLFWTVNKDCDVIELDSEGKEVLPLTGVYLLNLDDNALYQLSDAKESFSLFDQQLVIVRTGCMTDFKYKAIYLKLN